MFLDPTFLLLIPGLLFALWAQAKVKGAYRRYSEVYASSGKTAAEVAHEMLHRADLVAAVETGAPGKAFQAEEQLRAVRVEPVAGELTDHYDPRDNTLHLSEEVYRSTSIAALGIAAHEAGHAMQHATRYGPMSLRSVLVPVASLGSNLAFPFFFLGFIFSAGSHGGGWGLTLMDIGIWLFSAAVAFTLITLPVELNASRRALLVLERGGYLRDDEMPGARAVLNAAAWTYVAATAMAVLSLLRLVILRNMRDAD